MSIGRGNKDDSTSLIHLQNEINIINERIREFIINNRIAKKRINELTSKND